jgi:hypothetical protein
MVIVDDNRQLALYSKKSSQSEDHEKQENDIFIFDLEALSGVGQNESIEAPFDKTLKASNVLKAQNVTFKFFAKD